MIISETAFKMAAAAINKPELQFTPDRIVAGDKENVIFEWSLMTSTLRLEYCSCGVKHLTYRTIGEPTKDQELNAGSMGALSCHSAKRYMEEHGIDALTAQPEDFVNILLHLESKLAREGWHNMNESQKDHE